MQRKRFNEAQKKKTKIKAPSKIGLQAYLGDVHHLHENLFELDNLHIEGVINCVCWMCAVVIVTRCSKHMTSQSEVVCR